MEQEQQDEALQLQKENESPTTHESDPAPADSNEEATDEPNTERTDQETTESADAAGEQDDSSDTKKKKVVKPVSAKKLAKIRDEINKRGVIYLSRVPPYMKAQRLRQMLSQFGEVDRVFLTPEDPAIARKRKKLGKNHRKNFVDGWVEFVDKRIARRVAESLNNTPIGGKKRDRYYHDLWMMKYLKGFKWTHLTEKIAYEKAVRQQKIREEMAQAKRENKFYMEKVNQAKTIASIESKKQKKRKAEDENETETAAEESSSAKRAKIMRTFPQKQPCSLDNSETSEIPKVFRNTDEAQ